MTVADCSQNIKKHTLYKYGLNEVETKWHKKMKENK